jgi:hypothetical protein
VKTFGGPNLSWVGFDTFTGLPTNWIRNGDIYLASGSFLTGGKVLFILDLDLVEPSLSAWKEISPHLCSGDLLYFDQASKSED